MKPARGYLLDVAVVRLKDGRILAGGSKGVYEITGGSSPASLGIKQLSDLQAVSSLTEGSDGTVFAGTWSHGLYRLVPAGTRCEAKRVNELRMMSIANLGPATEGSVWVCSDDGIGLVEPQPFAQVPMSLDNLYIESLLRTDDGDILATDGRSVFALTCEDGTFASTKIFSPHESLILSLAGSSASLLVGFRDGFIFQRDKKGVSHPPGETPGESPHG